MNILKTCLLYFLLMVTISSCKKDELIEENKQNVFPFDLFAFKAQYSTSDYISYSTTLKSGMFNYNSGFSELSTLGVDLLKCGYHLKSEYNNDTKEIYLYNGDENMGFVPENPRILVIDAKTGEFKKQVELPEINVYKMQYSSSTKKLYLAYLIGGVKGEKNTCYFSEFDILTGTNVVLDEIVTDGNYSLFSLDVESDIAYFLYKEKLPLANFLRLKKINLKTKEKEVIDVSNVNDSRDIFLEFNPIDKNLYFEYNYPQILCILNTSTGIVKEENIDFFYTDNIKLDRYNGILYGFQNPTCYLNTGLVNYPDDKYRIAQVNLKTKEVNLIETPIEKGTMYFGMLSLQ